MNQWYATCDDVDRPDYVHFDLDPGPGAEWDHVLEAGRIVGSALEAIGTSPLVNTTGSRGLHVDVPLVGGPQQKDVWTFAKALAVELAARHGALLTAEYRVAQRPRGRVLVNYNQNAWGRTLASIYSVRPRSQAPVSTPVTWKEVERAVGSRISASTPYSVVCRSSVICGGRCCCRDVDLIWAVSSAALKPPYVAGSPEPGRIPRTGSAGRLLSLFERLAD